MMAVKELNGDAEDFGQSIGTLSSPATLRLDIWKFLSEKITSLIAKCTAHLACVYSLNVYQA